ncbi:Eco57I restriction-modification methylase domain-containing protein [Sneathiella sp. HT1-7]|uniref:Eco57I restriction-modification methylase domain-containing protein n=1 Tax=Sneathiella sp. HT1-7 TaxID=2887192 RepID=UPI001D14A355|nr:N-6 DNA methylase [Sneathiella sp. HT1-7]MCC3306603.1 N-6 DNA methylase [Sneathiella sp. HT1-7]
MEKQPLQQIELVARMESAAAGKQCFHGEPRRGYVLSTAVEEVAKNGRRIVTSLSEAFAAHPTMINRGIPVQMKHEYKRVAWLSFSIWLVALAGKCIKAKDRLSHSEAWSLGRPLSSAEYSFWCLMDNTLSQELEAISRCSGIRELLPYILESHGPGSRLSVKRNPSTQKSRTKKKNEGVFYTPLDVANFMARSAMERFEGFQHPKVLDPAVGTGVFLRAVLAVQKKNNPSINAFKLASETLFGCDIDPLALDGAASVLLLDTIESAVEVMPSPMAAWTMLRRNLKNCDALLIDKEAEFGEQEGRILLNDIFPAAKDGFDLVIGNPPYAGIGIRDDVTELANRFRSIAAKPKPTADLYPVFIEQMVRLCASEGVGAMVVPLSIAYNSGTQFAACRAFIQEKSGTWKFSFFDRQPHALFGEDVKTRNAILLWQNQRQSKKIFSGPLRKWRGYDRQKMLQNICYTRIRGDIRAGIPKIHGTIHAELFEQVSNEPVRLGHLVPQWDRTTLDTVPFGSMTNVFVSPTAYNFLGIGRVCVLTTNENEALSTNPLIRLTCGSSKDADAAFAILSGNFAYWWWHVWGDGFHVNRATLVNLPIGRLTMSETNIDQLARLGREIWNLAVKNPVRSLNRGRVSYTFSAAAAPDLRRRVDNIVLASLNQPRLLSNELERFTKTITSAELFMPNQEIQEERIQNDQKNLAGDKGEEQAYERGMA